MRSFLALDKVALVSKSKKTSSNNYEKKVSIIIILGSLRGLKICSETIL